MAVIAISCCAHSQDENCCTFVVHNAGWQQKNQSFVCSAAKILAATYRRGQRVNSIRLRQWPLSRIHSSAVDARRLSQRNSSA